MPLTNPCGGGPDPWTWVKLPGAVSNSAVTLASITGLSFTASANTTYIVEIVGAFQSAATTTGIALALDIPSGSVSGVTWHPVSATALGSSEQIATAGTTGATTGVRAANSNTPVNARFLVSVGATGGVVDGVTSRIRAVVPINVILFANVLTLTSGEVKLHTSPGGASTGETDIDLVWVKAANNTQFGGNVDGSLGEERGVGANTYHFRPDALSDSTGVWTAWWEERP